jgi:hypothetical protein
MAARVGAWLFTLPFRWRGRGLSRLLDQIATEPFANHGADRVLVTVRVVRRVSRLGLFSAPIFPKACLRESLALFRMLSGAGHPVRFYVGVRKDGDMLVAHSWVTLHGRPLLPGAATERFRTVYTYPADPSSGRSNTGDA